MQTQDLQLCLLYNKVAYCPIKMDEHYQKSKAATGNTPILRMAVSPHCSLTLLKNNSSIFTGQYYTYYMINMLKSGYA